MWNQKRFFYGISENALLEPLFLREHTVQYNTKESTWAKEGTISWQRMLGGCLDAQGKDPIIIRSFTVYLQGRPITVTEAFLMSTAGIWPDKINRG